MTSTIQLEAMPVWKMHGCLFLAALVCYCVSCWLGMCLRRLFSRCAHTLMLTLLLLLPCRHLRNAWQQWRLVSKSWTSIAAVAATLGQEQVGPAACCPACAAAPLEPGEQETGKACPTSHCFGSCLWLRPGCHRTFQAVSSCSSLSCMWLS